MEKAKTIIILLLVIIASGGWYNWYKEYKKPAEVITKIETRVDTVKAEKPVPVYTNLVSYKFFDVPLEHIVYLPGESDTVQVSLPITHKTYQDTTYKVEISGVNPNLEYIETYNRSTTITQTQLVYKKPIVSVGPAVSAG